MSICHFGLTRNVGRSSYESMANSVYVFGLTRNVDRSSYESMAKSTPASAGTGVLQNHEVAGPRTREAEAGDSWELRQPAVRNTYRGLTGAGPWEPAT